MIAIRLILCGVTIVSLILAAVARANEADLEFFEKQVRPILVNRCESCHSAAKGKTFGGLALDSLPGWQKGGESGRPILPGNAQDSLLVQAVLYKADGPQMPPQEAGGKLPEAEIAVLTSWVQRGAFDPRVSTAKRGGLTAEEIAEWWSFQPLKPIEATSIVATEVHGEVHSNEIDDLLGAARRSAGLTATAPADRRTLIRRLTYDLTGLPPTPEAVDTFVADNSPHAYDSLVDNLLNSPRYGERWGRHWLDVVRYADTAGENTDHPIVDAWRYRNWVIDSFNRDQPYDQFVRDQIAGDLLHASGSAKEYAAGVIATGFLATARRFDHDSDKFMHLTIEDNIDTVGRAFLGLSIACARCHDHKYDPISANDYYALYGIFSSTKYAFPGCEAKQQPRDLVPLLSPTEWAETVEPFDRELVVLDAELEQIESEYSVCTREFSAAQTTPTFSLGNGEIADGSSQSFTIVAESQRPSTAVAVGEMLQLTIDPAGNYGADTTSIEWEISEVGGQSRKWNLAYDVVDDFANSNPHADHFGNAAVWLFLDARGSASPLREHASDVSGKPGLGFWRTGDNPAVFVNATHEPISVWTTLAPRTVFCHPAADGSVAIAWVSPIEGQVEIRGRITDVHPGGPNGIGWKLDRVSGNHGPLLQAMVEAGHRRTQLTAKRVELAARAPLKEMAYAVSEGSIADTRIQLRGDPERLGDPVPRRWLELFGAERVSDGEGSGRRQLAGWLTDPANPLTARVMVNRIWQQHFGKGLVQTPNDFGTRGQRPTHPELLDWLAAKFINSGWSVKAMHRLIVHSDSYQRSAGDLTEKEAANASIIDPNNNLYWRFDRQRLNAEELRDTLLTFSQELDITPGTAHPIPPEKSWSFTQHGPFTGVPETRKRSVYQMTLRNRRDAFMGLFDGADPNTTTPQRQVTTVPTQSLFFLNDGYFHSQAERLAKRVLNEADDYARLNALFRIVLQRQPQHDERAAAMTFLNDYGTAVADMPLAEQPLAIWSGYSRVLLSSNEFLYLD